MTGPSTTLAYDRSLNREGISVDQNERFVQVITPRIGNWRVLGRGWIALIGVLAFFAAFPLVAAITSPAADRIGMLIASGEYAVFLALAVLSALAKLRQQYIFEITRETFSVTRTQITGSRRTWIYHRDAITDVHASAEPGRLIMHVRGQEMLDVYVSPNRSLAEQVAEALNCGLRAKMGARAKSDGSALIADLAETAARTRKAMFVVVVVLGLSGIILGLAVHPALAIPAWLAMAIPIGIAMGTQEKKFWI